MHRERKRFESLFKGEQIIVQIKKRKKLYKLMTIVVLISIPIYDIIATNLLALYFCSVDKPVYTNEVNAYPLSIYWEDNVYKGFTPEDRKRMIVNYLDGEHLKTMALNGDDGKVYVYTLDAPIWKNVEKNFNEKRYGDIWTQYAMLVMKSERIFDKETMPKLNYTVRFNEVALDPFSSNFLYSDISQVIDNQSNKIIAENQRYMRFFYNIFPDFAGNRFYYQKELCGTAYQIHLKTFDMLNWRKYGFKEHEIDLNEYLYKKYIKKEQ